MYKHIIYLIALFMLIGTSVIQAEIVITTETGNGADTYLSNDGQGASYGPNINHGADTSLRAFRQLADTRSKAAYIRFDISNIAGDMSDAILTFDLSYQKGSGEVNVYGLIDGEGDFWDESTITYNNAPGVLPATLGNCVLDMTKYILLGTINVPGPGTYPVTFSSNPTDLPLASFLSADGNGLVTFIFLGSGSNEGEIASKEHATYMAPTLTLPHAAIGVKTQAHNPNPADKAVDVPKDAELSWTPGKYAAEGGSHNVFIGTDFNDVNEASIIAPLSAAFVEGLDVNNYEPGKLELGMTYYWRVDEVNAPSNPGEYKGNVWQFTIEPFALKILTENITASSLGGSEDSDPNQTINESGLDPENMDLHSKVAGNMWVSTGDVNDIWIRYDFDKVYKLDEMLVWNYNIQFTLKAGFKDVTVEYSEDGQTWKVLADVPEFAQGTGKESYLYNTVVDFNGIAAQSVRLTANSNWSNGTITKVGLSEVRFMYIPVLAREPYPEDKASDVSVESALIWRAGRGVDKHNLYIGTDVNAVTEGTASVIILDEAAYAPNLELGSTYYWRVDEVNEAEEHTIWIGPVWNFSTITDFVVENFEAGYDDSDANAVWATWIDGYGNESVNGGIIGYDFPGPYLSTTNHSGGHSVPLRYDNTTAGYSEATAQVVDLPIGTTDWRTGNPGVLVIWFYGDPANNAQNMYVKINNKKVVYGNSADLLKPLWIQWNIDLNTAGINLANVTSLTIGLEKIGGIGGRGTVLIDDMRLYREAPAVPSEMVWVEAETGTVTAPMMMYDDVTASGGRYVSTTDDTADEGTAPPYPNGTVTIPFTVEGGTYTVRFLIGFPGGDDSCWVRIPGAAIQSAVTPLTNGWMEFNDIPTGDYWHWSQSVKHEGGAEPPVEFTLSAGTHNIEISYRANALRFDVILFTKID